MPPPVIVNAEGVDITPVPPNKKPFILKIRAKKKVTTLEDLEKLEDCIFADVEKRNEFLRIYRSAPGEESFEKYLEKHTNRREVALRFCWEMKNWRPSKCGKTVRYHHPNNPYLK